MIRDIAASVLIGAVLLVAVWLNPGKAWANWIYLAIAAVIFAIALRRFHLLRPREHRG